ncbi:oxidoreductase [Halomicroarcula sp. S1AR25-4]|uniref:proton-conducting transporter transmembrane domain-containing protein n=1 Tax=Haloarcula sp. S1AR25-4 TaxID=2950538 RepID=UPI00287592B7|nr:proton-conducting transporter membrane subunit [Halomicroarcula sp. S1AR25-4]MDS0277646.1 oxidoreductase [Halomicroarcula sp. S1AR25-4]
MTEQQQTTAVGQLPNTGTKSTSLAPRVFTCVVWALCVASLGVLVARFVVDGAWTLPGVAAVDGLTAVMWVVVTFFSGIVHSYSRRYMAGSRTIDRFFGGVFAFTLAVMVLVAADHVALFAAAWVAMGIVMADLIGHVRGWPQAQAAATLARRYFLASGALLTVALVTLWLSTGATTVSGIVAAADTVPQTAWLVAAGALLLAAMIQSALVPFHTWLLSSMTAPTPASALMHAGFVNAGGVLLVRFAPVVTADAQFMLLLLAVGATSALLGKLLKTVQSDVKRQLGCSTVGQMGFMIMQAGLGFFGAALTHLVLHGFYKAYQFLSAGEQVEQTAPGKADSQSAGVLGAGVALLSALAGGAVFAALTGKGTHFDSGLLLAGLVVLTTLHATRTAVAQTDLPAAVRFGAVPLVFLPAIAVYALAYNLVHTLLVDVPVVTAPADLTLVHGVVAAAFLAVYVAIERGAYEHSQRLYVALLNLSQPPSDTVLTAKEDYNEY